MENLAITTKRRYGNWGDHEARNDNGVVNNSLGLSGVGRGTHSVSFDKLNFLRADENLDENVKRRDQPHGCDPNRGPENSL